MLRDVVGGAYVPTVSQYIADLEEAGFENVEFLSLTKVYRKWTDIRNREFIKNREKWVGVRGPIARSQHR